MWWVVRNATIEYGEPITWPIGSYSHNQLNEWVETGFLKTSTIHSIKEKADNVISMETL